MTACRRVRELLVEALLARRAPGDAERAHCQACAPCAAQERELRELAAALEALPAPPLPPELLARTRRRTARALQRPAPSAPLPLPGYRRELARLLLAAAAGLPVVWLWNAVVLRLGGELLAGLVPPALLAALGAAYVVAAAGWLGVLFGSIPFVAHGQTRRRLQEAPS